MLRWARGPLSVALAFALLLAGLPLSLLVPPGSFFGPSVAFGATLVVDGDGQGTSSDCDSTTVTPYTTIGAAITAAVDNDTIVVCPGTYNENVTVNGGKDNLTIQGPGGITLTDIGYSPSASTNAIIDSPGGAHAVLVSGVASFAMTGMVVQDADAEFDGIHISPTVTGVVNVSSNMALNNWGKGISANLCGPASTGVSSVTINNNLVVGNGNDGIDARTMGYSPNCGAATAVPVVSISNNTVSSPIEQTPIDVDLLNTGASITDPQTGTITSINIDGNKVTGSSATDPALKGINGGYLLGNFSASSGNTSSIGAVSISNNTITGGGHLHIYQMMRYLGYANSCLVGGGWFGDVGTVTVTSVTIDGNTINNGTSGGAGKLHATYLLSNAGGVNASCGAASTRKVTVGPVSVSSNTLNGGMLDLEYLLGYDDQGYTVYADNTTGTLGDGSASTTDLSVGNVTINSNSVTDNDINLESAFYGFGGAYSGIFGATANVSKITLGNVSVSSNKTLGSSGNRMLNMNSAFYYAGSYNASGSSTITADGLTIGNVSTNSNQLSGALDAASMMYYLYNIDAGTGSTVNVGALTLGDVSFNSNNGPLAATTDAMGGDLGANDAMYYLAQISATDATAVTMGAVDIGLVSLNSNALGSNNLNADNILQYAGRTGVTGSDVTRGTFTGDGLRANSNTLDTGGGEVNMRSAVQYLGAVEALIGSDVDAGALTFGAIQFNSNTAQCLNLNDVGYYAFKAEASGGSTIDVTSATLNGFFVDGNTIGNCYIDVSSAFYNLAYLNDDTSGGLTITYGPVSTGNFSISNNTFSQSGGEGIYGGQFLYNAFQVKAYNGGSATLGIVTVGTININNNAPSPVTADYIDLIDFDGLLGYAFQAYADGSGSLARLGTTGGVTLGAVSVSNNTLPGGNIDLSHLLTSGIYAEAFSGGTATVGNATLGAISINSNTLGTMSGESVTASGMLMLGRMLENLGYTYSSSTATATLGNVTVGAITVNSNTTTGSGGGGSSSGNLTARALMESAFNVYAGGGSTSTVGNINIISITFNGNTLRGGADLWVQDNLADLLYLNAGSSGDVLTVGTVNVGDLAYTNNTVSNGGELDAYSVLSNVLSSYNYGKTTVGAVTLGQIIVDDNTISGGGGIDAYNILGGGDTAFYFQDYSGGVSPQGTTIGNVVLDGVSISGNTISDGGELDAEYLSGDLLSLYAGDGEVAGRITMGTFNMAPIIIDDNTLTGGGEIDAKYMLESPAQFYAYDPSPSTITTGAITYQGVQVTNNTVTGGDIKTARIFEDGLYVYGGSSGTVNLGAVVLGQVDITGNTLNGGNLGAAGNMFESAAYAGGEPAGSVPSVTLGPVNITDNQVLGASETDLEGHIGMHHLGYNVGSGFRAPDFALSGTGKVTMQDVTVSGNTIQYGEGSGEYEGPALIDALYVQYYDNGSHVVFGKVNIVENTIEKSYGAGVQVGSNNGHTKSDINILRNTINHNSDYGVIALSPSSTVEVHHNNIYCNHQTLGNGAEEAAGCGMVQAEDQGGSTALWTGTDPVLGTNLGNYWGTQFYANTALLTTAITDSDNDGVGDTGGPAGSGKAPIDPPVGGPWTIFDTKPVMALTDWTVSDNANLGSLTLTNPTTPYSPTFSAGTTSYSATVANSTSSITVTATPEDLSATVSINGVAGTSRTVSLGGGSNTITILVTASDGVTQKTYTVTITREPEDTNDGGGGAPSPAPSPEPSPAPTPEAPPPPPPPPAEQPVTPTQPTTIDVGGGSNVDGGVSVVIEEGSVDIDVQVEIVVTNAPPPDVDEPTGGELLDKTIEITVETPDIQGVNQVSPDGRVATKFTLFSINKPVEILVNLTTADLKGKKIEDVRGGRVEGTTINQLPIRVVDAQKGIVAVWTDHFTKFTLFTVTKPVPTLTTPAADTVLTDLGTQLSWSNPLGTTQYQVQVLPFNNDGPGINLIRNVETSFTVKAPSFGSVDANYVMLPDMSYVWRVRTTASTKTQTQLTEADWSAWSVRVFRTAKVGVQTIDRVAPQGMEVVSGLLPTLVWSNSNKRVFYYEVQVSKDPNFGLLAFLYWELRHGGVTSPLNSYTIPSQYPLEAGTTYYWRVRPRIQGDGDRLGWSTAFMFQTP